MSDMRAHVEALFQRIGDPARAEMPLRRAWMVQQLAAVLDPKSAWIWCGKCETSVEVDCDVVNCSNNKSAPRPWYPPGSLEGISRARAIGADAALREYRSSIEGMDPETGGPLQSDEFETAMRNLKPPRVT